MACDHTQQAGKNSKSKRQHKKGGAGGTAAPAHNATRRQSSHAAHEAAGKAACLGWVKHVRCRAAVACGQACAGLVGAIGEVVMGLTQVEVEVAERCCQWSQVNGRRDLESWEETARRR